ncbi:hypothetical protein RRF57_010857 [Xylaria bambusicola]|uniref:Uncharacterized protein n=1 Tax=Xylaria bambusicola TaxID=326684 RepID=A0AAN7ULV5_9PEZI
MQCPTSQHVRELAHKRSRTTQRVLERRRVKSVVWRRFVTDVVRFGYCAAAVSAAGAWAGSQEGVVVVEGRSRSEAGC